MIMLAVLGVITISSAVAGSVETTATICFSASCGSSSLWR